MLDIVHYSAKVEPEPDHRYRMMVVLARSDRPVHDNFHCPRCTRKVAEITHSEVLAISDVTSLDQVNSVGVRCDGRNFETGKNCRTWYYFTVAA